MPDDFDDDEPDPDAGPSGHNGPPLLPLDGDEPFNPSPMPENDPQPDTQDQQEPEEGKKNQKKILMTQFLMVPQILMRLLTTMILLLMILNGVFCPKNKSYALTRHHSLCLD